MGWFGGTSDDKDGAKSQDPLRDLDPSLREFLAKESPVKYNTSEPQPVAPKPIPAQEPKKAQPEPVSPESNDPPKAPAQSLYQDGRYAHLWKTYVPQNQIEESMKSDAEKVTDVIDAYKFRKAQIGMAALENCAIEQWEVNECFQRGGWAAKMTMCGAENRKMDRCYTLQGKFLRALGFLSSFDRPPEVDEKIQMHADTLYHRMLDQEKDIEKAKAEGRPIPSFPPLLSSAKQIKEQTALTDSSKLPAKTQADLKERTKDMSVIEKELEEASITAEINSGRQVAGGLSAIYRKQDAERAKRKEEGKETLGDRFTSIIRWF
ncbi:autophagy protein [Phlyctema vagabunda]|uniref:Autophagy protein n=1 Tax=Phlyctema vagabunda TaxID=108571 RepID=A0ABR4P5F2_9HELO